jgi:glycosyltransferase involved in cell wall biosynthesis
MIIVGHSGIGFDDFWNLWCFPTVFVALSSSAKSWAQKKNPFVRVVTIPNGIWPSQFSPNGKKAPLTLNHPIYLYAGALEAGKRPSLAIEAVARLKKGSLLILGRGDTHMETEIDHLGNELLGNRYIRKSVPHGKMAEYYRAADVFTLPTGSQEAFGMVYLEAMSCGLPVVTTDDPVKREIIGKGGIFVDPTNLSEYSDALQVAARTNKPEISQQQAHLFSWPIISKKYMALFQKSYNL